MARGKAAVINGTVNGIRWNFLQGPRNMGMLILMDYPTRTGTWHSIQGYPLTMTATTVLPAQVNNVYGHAYIFTQEIKQ
jgi:hypothetical protein